jgi:hypothetical protein
MTQSILAVRSESHWDFRTVLKISRTSILGDLDLDGHVPPPPPGGRWMLHISPTVVQNADWPGLPPSGSTHGLLMFGSSAYRGEAADATAAEESFGNVYLAWAPLTPAVVPAIPQADKWQFFAGLDANNAPQWRTLADGPPSPLLPNDPGGFPRKLGEISAAWYPILRRWILAGSLQAPINVARQPWGPWTTSSTICDAGKPDRDAGNGLVSWTDANMTYAPYLIGRWSRWDRSLRDATVYFTLSGFDDRPGKTKYQPQLIRSTIRCWPP